MAKKNKKTQEKTTDGKNAMVDQSALSPATSAKSGESTEYESESAASATSDSESSRDIMDDGGKTTGGAAAPGKSKLKPNSLKKDDGSSVIGMNPSSNAGLDQTEATVTSETHKLNKDGTLTVILNLNSSGKDTGDGKSSIVTPAAEIHASNDAGNRFTASVTAPHAQNLSKGTPSVASYAEMVKSNRKFDNDVITLRKHNVQPVISGDRKKFTLPKSAIAEHRLEVLSLVGFFPGKFPGRKEVNKLAESWRVQCHVYFHNSGWIIFNFAAAGDMNKVLSGGPYYVFGVPLVMKKMPKLFNFSKEEYSKVPVWVQLPNLPYACWNDEALSYICSLIGTPLHTDTFTATAQTVSFARCLVEIDVSKPLTHVLDLDIPGLGEFTQFFCYEDLPKYCTKCNRLGHMSEVCKGNLTDIPSVYKPKPKPESNKQTGNAKQSTNNAKRPKNTANGGNKKGNATDAAGGSKSDSKKAATGGDGLNLASVSVVSQADVDKALTAAFGAGYVLDKSVAIKNSEQANSGFSQALDSSDHTEGKTLEQNQNNVDVIRPGVAVINSGPISVANVNEQPSNCVIDSSILISTNAFFPLDVGKSGSKATWSDEVDLEEQAATKSEKRGRSKSRTRGKVKETSGEHIKSSAGGKPPLGKKK